MKTDELIVRLARAAGPVRPLPRPGVRLARWAVSMLPVAAAGVLLIGPRADVLNAIRQPAFLGLALAALATALLSAGAAFVLSVPGAERSPRRRLLPLAAGAAWVLLLVALLSAGGDAAGRLAALPVHWGCVIRIAVLGMLPVLALFVMLRRAAPLQRVWTAALATLAAMALGAAATQFICPLDDPAHHLVGHVLPAIVFTAAGTLAGRRALDWMQRP